MTRPLPTTTPMNVQAVRTHVDSELADFLDTKTHLATGNRLPQEASLVLRDFLLAGGKRLRPLLCVIGWHTAGGEGDTIPVLRPCPTW
ncbi:hypothetical protein [Streptomyces sp. x-80]|uniref:hypothetical protein n=1 Tax=Streptomyces sp. x-80 TaxID=2789282 RepID=UPI003980C604